MTVAANTDVGTVPEGTKVVITGMASGTGTVLEALTSGVYLKATTTPNAFELYTDAALT
eukprot:COSAG06_NODE_5059_length_3755_cov_2.121171_1_plen_58_part_10